MNKIVKQGKDNAFQVYHTRPVCNIELTAEEAHHLEICLKCSDLVYSDYVVERITAVIQDIRDNGITVNGIEDMFWKMTDEIIKLEIEQIKERS